MRIAVPAAVKEREDIVRQVLDRPLLCVGNDLVRQAAVADQEVGANFKTPRRSQKAGPDIAERIEALRGRNARAQLNALRSEKVFLARWMHAEQKHHRHILIALECDVVAGPNFQGSLLYENASDKPGSFASFRSAARKKAAIPCVQFCTNRGSCAGCQARLKLQVCADHGPPARITCAALPLCWPFYLFAASAGAQEDKKTDDLKPADPDTGESTVEESTLGLLPNPLEKWGIKFAATYIGETLDNPSGGLKQSAIYEGRLNLAVDVDLEKLAGHAAAHIPRQHVPNPRRRASRAAHC